MKKGFVIAVCMSFAALATRAQVTRINSNNSLHVVIPLNSVTTILASDIDSSIWVTEGTLASTVQISATIKLEEGAGIVGGKFIFRAKAAATGSEIYATDGTPGGTALVKDIYSGSTGSNPSDFAMLNGFIYFSAATLAEGRELWKTDGTNGGTTLVKDIVSGGGSSNTENNYNLFSTGTYLLFSAQTAAEGNELWKSDGTNGGTMLLKDINTGVASSNPKQFFNFNNTILFAATTVSYGSEVWLTDGTTGGTTLLKDINPGVGSSTEIELFPGFSFPLLSGFHVFQNRAYFNATDGTSNGEMWATYGTTANTALLKDFAPGAAFPNILINDAVNLPTKFIFPVSDGDTRSELWECDGSTSGTVLFKSFTAASQGDLPFIFIGFNFSNGNVVSQLFQGNKFFFKGGSSANGDELWVSDGTVANTVLVKDIKSGSGSSLTSPSYIYTTSSLYFAADDGIHGNELWKSDGTLAGTTMVQDININTGNSDPELSIINNGKIIFSATDGDSPTLTDLFVVDGVFSPLPVKLAEFAVARVNNDAKVQWTTLQEINTSHFTIQRSMDALHFENIGIVQALGNSAIKHNYSFTDADIASSGKTILYYRLLTNNKDGSTTLSSVVSLKLNAAKWNIQVLGQASNGILNFALTGVTGQVQIALNDMSGKMLYANKISVSSSPIAIPVDNLPHGIYMLSVLNGNETKSVQFVR